MFKVGLWSGTAPVPKNWTKSDLRLEELSHNTLWYTKYWSLKLPTENFLHSNKIQLSFVLINHQSIPRNFFKAIFTRDYAQSLLQWRLITHARVRAITHSYWKSFNSFSADGFVVCGWRHLNFHRRLSVPGDRFFQWRLKKFNIFFSIFKTIDFLLPSISSEQFQIPSDPFLNFSFVFTKLKRSHLIRIITDCHNQNPTVSWLLSLTPRLDRHADHTNNKKINNNMIKAIP